jgi:hypothetical protein
MNKITKYLERLSPLLFGLVIFTFFALKYNYHLNYHEQLQMFLFTSDYFSNLASCPGGIADYLGTFFVQFYYYSWLGAFVISAMLVILQQQIRSLSNRLNSGSLFYPLTFIPSVLFWALLCDENFLLTALIAVIITLGFVQIYTLLKQSRLRIIVFVIMLTCLYWTVGGVFGVFGVLCLIVEFLYFKQLTKMQWGVFVISFLLIVVASPFIAKNFLQYPLSRLWWGLSYYRYPVVSPYLLLVVWLTVILIPMIIRSLPSGTSKTIFIIVVSTQLIVLSTLSGWLIHSTADWSKEEIMAYDYSVRTQNWNAIISMANHKDPSAPLSVACLNLALSKNGTLGDCMFRYYQNGPEGLLPTFQRDFTLPFIAGEMYYHLGFLNTSMRYAFEAMEAIPDYKKSSRAIKRVAEVNLLNGEYRVATKYLHLLQHTLFYSDWADSTLLCVGNKSRIDKNKEWAALRKYQFTKDFLFSEEEKDQMLGLMVTHCPTNKMAYDYLMAYALLTKDLKHFVQYYQLGKTYGYKNTQAHYQEALIFIWANKTSQLNNSPWGIDESVKKAFSDYAKIYSTVQKDDAVALNAFNQTYWYYLNFRN